MTDIPDIYNLDNFNNDNPDTFEITITNKNVMFNYNNLLIKHETITVDHDIRVYLHELNGIYIDKIFNNKCIRVICNDVDDADDAADITFTSPSSNSSYIYVTCNTICKLDCVESIEIFMDVRTSKSYKYIIYIYNDVSIAHSKLSSVTIGNCHNIIIIHPTLKITGTYYGFTYDIVFGLNLDCKKVYQFLIKMKYYNYYKEQVLISSICKRFDLYYYKYIINNVIYLCLHKIIYDMNTYIFATKNNSNRILYKLDTFSIFPNSTHDIRINIENYTHKNYIHVFRKDFY